MKNILKNYYKWGGILIALLFWVLILGPKMLSGSTEMILFWLAGGLFGIVPLLATLIYNQFFKEKKIESNS